LAERQTVNIEIDHVALWTNDLERLRSFYITFFEAKSSQKYRNEKKAFESYFLSFINSTRIEIMSIPKMSHSGNNQIRVGISHFAFRVGSKDNVELLTQKIKDAGCPVLSEPRLTGDGYFESVILDPDNNQIEIVA
jgi:lactoylglutathione lyase